MNCLYCDKPIDKKSFKSIFIEDDCLCINCRNKIKPSRMIVNINNLKIETFFEYDSLFKDLLIQYKECFDEALKDVFIYDIYDYLMFKYFNYQILYVPSSSKKLALRGFNHLELMFSQLKFKKVEGLTMKQDLFQEGKTAEERKKMIGNYKYEGKRIKRLLIVDDVLTTGSSLFGVYKAMRPYCDKIAIIALSNKRKRFQLEKNSATI